MVNDINTSGVNLTMFVDDMTNIDVVSNGTLHYLQPIVDYFVSQSVETKFSFNVDKCKEMRVQISIQYNI